MEGKHKNKILFFAILLTVFLVGFLLANSALADDAADSDFIITEIMFDPAENSTCAENGWLELYFNVSKTYVTKKSGGRYKIENLRICDKWDAENDTCRKDKNAEGKTTKDYSHPIYYSEKDFVVKKGDFFILTDNPKIPEDCSNLPEAILSASFELLKIKDATLSFSNDDGNKWFSKTDYSPSWGAKGNGKTLERISLTENEWQESFVCGGTPGKKSSSAASAPEGIIINEIFPNPPEGEKEFVELFNASNQEINLGCWYLYDNTNKPNYLPPTLIKPGEYFVHQNKFQLNNDGDRVGLKNSANKEVDFISYKEKAEKNHAYARKDGIFQWTTTPTPGKENIITLPEETKPADENLSSAEKVYLNEIFPNPKGDERAGEFIEIVNRESEAVDLYKWMVRDGSKTGKYVFKEHTFIEPDKFLVIYRPQFKIALNNSKENASLINPQGKITSTASYDKSTENASYNFDGKIWKWSKFLTPGAQNKFDQPPKIVIKKIKRAYKNLYAKFSVKAKDKESKTLKYVWDFGDGRKSYLAKTSHKYLAPGKYRVTLAVRDDSQTVEKKFIVRVKKYPRPDLELTKIVPNPAGRDTENEIVEVKNNSPKEVDLNGWKIATGAAKIFNHPITADLKLAPGETKAVTRKFSKFLLNNKAGKVQLLFPDGKVADSVEYQKDPPDSLRDSKRAGKIVEDEAYVKLNDEWIWITPNKPDAGSENKEEISADEDAETKNIEEEKNEEGEVFGVADSTIIPYKTGFTSEDAYIFLSQLNFLKPARKMHYTPMFGSSSGIAYLLSLLI